MPAPLSIVIPTLNAASSLPGTAAALLPGVTAGLVRELVVSDGGSTDGTARIADSLGARLVTGAVGRGAQIAQGAAAARGDWLLILHADTVLSPDWVEAVETHLAAFPEHAGFFRLAFDATGTAARLVAGGANLRARYLGLPYGDQGLLIARATLERVGGVPDLPIMEDVALARALRGRLRPLDAIARTSAARYRRDGWSRRVARNLACLAAFRLGVPPGRIAKFYEASSPRN